MGGEVLIGFRIQRSCLPKVVFQPHFLQICDKGGSLKNTTCLKTVVGVSKGMLPVKYFRSNKASFVSVNLYGDRNTVKKLM